MKQDTYNIEDNKTKYYIYIYTYIYIYIKQTDRQIDIDRYIDRNAYILKLDRYVCSLQVLYNSERSNFPNKYFEGGGGLKTLKKKCKGVSFSLKVGIPKYNC